MNEIDWRGYFPSRAWHSKKTGILDPIIASGGRAGAEGTVPGAERASASGQAGPGKTEQDIDTRPVVGRPDAEAVLVFLASRKSQGGSYLHLGVAGWGSPWGRGRGGDLFVFLLFPLRSRLPLVLS